MALNRTELKTQIDTDIVPTLTTASHRDFLKNDQAESLVLRKDVIASQTPSGGNVTIDFSNKDTATVNTSSNLAISFTNIENGDVKYIEVTKNTGNTISFPGAFDVSQRRSFINASVTKVQYEVKHKNGLITVNSINIDNDITTQIDNIESDITTIQSNQNIRRKFINIPLWDMSGGAFLAVAHGLDATKIKEVQVVIFKSGDTESQGASFISSNGYWTKNSTNINLIQSSSSIFKNLDYESAYGRMTIWYTP